MCPRTRGARPESPAPILVRLRVTVADLARIDMQDRPRWRDVGGCCGQYGGQALTSDSARITSLCGPDAPPVTSMWLPRAFLASGNRTDFS